MLSLQISLEVSFHPISPEEHEVIKLPAEKSFYNPTENFFFSFLRFVKPPPPQPIRDPPHWPRREARIHHRNRKACRQALLCRSQRSGGGGAVLISAWRSGSQPGAGGAVPISAWKSGFRPGGGGVVPIGC